MKFGGTGIAPEATAGAGPAAPAGGWLRVHPASPFVRGWFALAAIGFFFGRDTFERMLRGGWVIFPGLRPWACVRAMTLASR